MYKRITSNIYFKFLTIFYSSDVKIILDDDDDVIVVPAEEPSITEIPDDDEEPIIAQDKEVIIDDDTSSKDVDVVKENDDATSQSKDEKTEKLVDDDAETTAAPSTITETKTESVTAATTKANSLQFNELNATYEPIGNESDIQILVPQISVLDLDDFEEKPDSGVMDDESSRASQSVKIKEEPKDDGYDYEEDDGFEEVGTFESDVIIDSPIIGKYFGNFFKQILYNL